MSCSTCKRRKLNCDSYRPRCTPCRRSHLKCEYTSASYSVQFQDETEAVKARSLKRKKRHSFHRLDNAGDAQDENTLNTPEDGLNLLNEPDQLWEVQQDAELVDQNSFMPWVDDLYEYFPDTFESLQFWQGVTESAIPLPGASLDGDTGTAVEPFAKINGDVTATSSTVNDENEQLEEIPDHFLAQHYTRNLTGRYSSKDRGWNYYNHFYSRFTNSHAFVLYALYSWTAVHLFYAGTLKSLDNAWKHYEKCLEQIKAVHRVDLKSLATSDPSNADQTNQLQTLSADDIDAIGVSLYFLASSNLLASRRQELEDVIRIMTVLLSIDMPCRRQNGLFLTVSTWFCSLDARMSAFGRPTSCFLDAIGGVNGLISIIDNTRDFLKQEYKMLYPTAETKRDEAHKPLLDLMLRLVANFVEISRFSKDLDNLSAVGDIRQALDGIKQALDAVDENVASTNRVLSTLYTTTALYHATEIYFSRMFAVNSPLYTANSNAAAIISTTEKLYRVLKFPKEEPPPTKMWPIPLVMAAIEASDPIYRDWALRKISDYSCAGEHFHNSIIFVETVHELEEKSGTRANLSDIMNSMGETVII